VRLSQLYSNKPDIFPRIQFNRGLNVILAQVTKPKDAEKDSHNLGKTLLLHLIDFMLLKSFEAGLFLYDNKKAFREFVFYLEIETNDGAFITVRRAVEAATKASFKVSDVSRDCSELADEEWDAHNLPATRSRQYLDESLSLTALRSWDYRKGLGYCLRAQGDYRDVFQLAKFAVGKHKDWKPFMAHLIGLDYAPIQEKYETDESIEAKKQAKIDVQEITGAASEAYDKLKGSLDLKRAEASEARTAVERFDFYQQDMELNVELVGRVENEIASLNDRIYTIDYEGAKIEEALARGLTFDLDAVEQLFTEARTLFPAALRKGYEELVDFNKRISSDRGKRLRERLVALRTERASHLSKLRELNRNREELLLTVQDTDTLDKYRRLHTRLVHAETEIARLEEQLGQLDKVALIDKEIRELEARRAELIERVRTMVRTGSVRYTTLKKEFNRVLRSILDVSALVSTEMNSSGNLAFEAVLLRTDEPQSVTSEDRGTSYRHLMCCAFDMALLSAHVDASFYRFVYHDGVFEGLDDRKKVKLLSVVEDLTDRLGMQYILTVIQSDLPRDANDRVILFPESAVVRRLFEGSDAGRLFRMPKF
jgi:uncharacterized protein YydD (DUF2326 family)